MLAHMPDVPTDWNSLVPKSLSVLQRRNQLMSGVRIVALTATILCAAACTSVTPRENYANFQNVDMGRHISQLIPGDALGTQTATLANGNREYTRNSIGPHGRCTLVREVDATTNRFVAWRTVGDDSGCQITP